MGVPAFFRWLTKKYPSVIVDCIEERPKIVNGVKIPVDSTKPNPNDIEFDNLYLDMNGIIHPCTHPEDKPAPKNEDEMMVAIFECIDRLFAIVRPRKLLYMAIDGVAPRAKMNQQRSRRFRASKETAEKIDAVERIRSELTAKGCFLPPEKAKGSHFDSNCITPGTPFMARLSTCLHYYVHNRLNTDPAWKDIQVILSDANVPGEGEHKIMDYIRRQRGQPDYNPNIQHVLCGADADLIMLGLATHEPTFTIIREEFKPNQDRPCDICGQMGHVMTDCQGLPNAAGDGDIEEPPTFGAEQQFIFVRLNVLREYLEKELHMPNLPFEFDLERAIDDWVFMCFFVGNDFLPHLPSLEIREGAIDRLVGLYKKAVYKTGGFLTSSGLVNPHRVQLIMQDLGEVEDEIFKKRQEDEIAFKGRMKAKKRRMRAQSEYKPSWVPRGQFAPQRPSFQMNPIQNPRQEAAEMRKTAMNYSTMSNSNQAVIKGNMRGEVPYGTPPKGSGGDPPQSSSEPSRGTKRKNPDESSEEEETPDEVRLWEDGFKDRYYESKFDVGPEHVKFRYHIAAEYVLGLCWVLRYYYQGCASWKWYFPYHYAPFASDFIDVGNVNVEFEKDTQPFRPLEQLMGVFPAASRSHVPRPWGELMIDPYSSIIDFYPVDFQIDLNGKKYAWQGVALLPFVEETRLKDSLKPLYEKLTDAEIRRNIRGDDRLYIHSFNKDAIFVTEMFENGWSGTEETEIDSKQFGGTSGMMLPSDVMVAQGDKLQSPVMDLEPVNDNRVVCIRFRDPKYADGFIFPSRRLPGTIEPPKVLKPGDLPVNESRNWRPQIGMTRSNNRASLGNAGHRMVNHYQNRYNSNQSNYNAVPGSYGSQSRGSSLIGTSMVSQSSNRSQGGTWRGSSSGNRGQAQQYSSSNYHGNSRDSRGNQQRDNQSSSNYYGNSGGNRDSSSSGYKSNSSNSYQGNKSGYQGNSSSGYQSNSSSSYQGNSNNSYQSNNARGGYQQRKDYQGNNRQDNRGGYGGNRTNYN